MDEADDDVGNGIMVFGIEQDNQDNDYFEDFDFDNFDNVNGEN